MRTKMLILLLALVLLHVIVIFAGFIAPCDPGEQNRELPYSPPTQLHFVDGSGFHLRPFVYASMLVVDSYQEDRTHEYPVHLFVTGDNYTVLGMFRSNVHLFRVDEPAHIFLFGADGFGRDEFSRLLYGGQISLAAGVLATLLSLTAGTIIGTISGYYGEWVDESLMGSAELFLSVPWLYFLIAVRAFLPLHVSPAGTFLLLICVIGLIGWSETFGVLLTQAALLVPQYVAAEATLSFFGLGVSEPVPSWGNMLSTLQQYNVLVSYGWLLAPAGALVVTSVIYWWLADALHSRLKSHSI